MTHGNRITGNGDIDGLLSQLLLQNGKTVGAYTAECSDAVLGANDPAQLEELNQIALKKGYSC